MRSAPDAPAAPREPPARAAALRIGGLTPWTSIDFPGHFAAVVFCQGCPWRCEYCHNPDLLPAAAETTISWADVTALLARRHGLLDGVVFSGGEPTLQAALPEAIAQVKALGYGVGLHTAGMYPDRLAAVLPRLDWIGLDLKAPWHRLDGITRSAGGARRVRASLAMVLASGIACECRTTWDPALFPIDELHRFADELARAGVSCWSLQQRRPAAMPSPISEADLAVLGGRFPRFTWRAA